VIIGERFPKYKLVVVGSPVSNDPFCSAAGQKQLQQTQEKDEKDEKRKNKKKGKKKKKKKKKKKRKENTTYRSRRLQTSRQASRGAVHLAQLAPFK